MATEMNGCCLYVGTTFCTFSALRMQSRDINNPKLCNCTSQTQELYMALQKVAKDCKRGITEVNIGYHNMKYACNRGGRKYCLEAKGIRPDQYTFSQGCKTEFVIKMMKNYKALTVLSINEEHNHKISEAAFHHLLQKRQLNKDDRQKVANLLQFHANKKLKRQLMQRKTGKLVTLRFYIYIYIYIYI